MEYRRRVGNKIRKNICAKGGRVESRSDPVTSRCTSSRTWREVKDDRASDKELLVARCDERCRKICGGM